MAHNAMLVFILLLSAFAGKSDNSPQLPKTRRMKSSMVQIKGIDDPPEDEASYMMDIPEPGKEHADIATLGIASSRMFADRPERDSVQCLQLRKNASGQCEPPDFSLYSANFELIACCSSQITNVEDLIAEKMEEVDLTMAFMLLGSVTLVMCLFYLVNHSDQDIKEYSWQVISATIAIFTSVLMFQAVNGVSEKIMEDGGLEEYGVGVAVGVVYFQLIVWFVMLEFIIARISFAHSDEVLPAIEEEFGAGGRGSTLNNSALYSSECSRMSVPFNREDTESRVKREKMLMLKCWSTLLAHTTGFAAIHAGGALQHLDIFSDKPLYAMMSVILNCVFLLLVFLISDTIRHGCGESVEVKMWDEETEEAENDIASLALSFLCSQALRFQLGGDLPGITGLEPSSMMHENCYVQGLLGCSAGCACISVLVLLFFGTSRWAHILQETVSLSFSWCIYYASKESVIKLVLFITNAEHLDQNTVCIRVSLACLVSMLALCIIFFLDTIEDMDFTGDAADKAIRSIIGAIGILVGFSWEQAFEGGVEVIAEVTISRGRWYPIITKLALATALAFLIVPAWRKYILKNTFLNQGLKEEHKQRRDERKREGHKAYIQRRISALLGFGGGEERRSSKELQGRYTVVPTNPGDGA